jgi:hypothetical protein
MSSEAVTELIDKVLDSPVFGDSFDREEIDLIAAWQQMEMVGGLYETNLATIISKGFPEMAATEVRSAVGRLATTCIGFAAGLSAGELENTERVADVAIVVGITGQENWSLDQLADPATPLAIDLWQGKAGGLPSPKLAKAVGARLVGLRFINTLMEDIALPEDLPFALWESQNLVRYELLAHRLSAAYKSQATEDKGCAFLDAHAREAADILTVTAALPSAAVPLYAAYRHEYEDLPPLADLYGDPQLDELHRVLNGFTRKFDDIGDRAIDMEAYSLNLYNQPNRAVLEAFLRNVGVDGSEVIKELTEAFITVGASDPESDSADPQAVRLIEEFFLNHVRNYVEGLPRDFQRRYATYLRLVKRAIEAAYVNRAGYEAIAA